MDREKERLISLRNKYIKELNNWKTKLKEIEFYPSVQRKKKKKVRFKIDERADSSLSHLIQERERCDTIPTRQCACDLECILEGNDWKCRRKRE